ncbi:MAG TPA: PilZ domain-containing protein [Dyella sp.]|uniref:PilZ domain-containing protein n=1 Tax=Dyella sp. TaxID=1869338 RepID=UPI002B89CA2B|nr:PilZ domain-containing protein [Dyella sp.]HTV86119.1 PilZ domain-containing protein [Dyella sp.]
MQTYERWQEFSQRMAYQGQPHVAAEALEPVPEAIARYNERNLHVLRALASFDERRVENPDDDSPLMQELQRMDSKINVLLDIIDRTLVPDSLLPARHAVRFNAVGAVLPESLLPPADTLLVRLHFDACRALPLELAARKGHSLGNGNAFVYFCEMSELVEDGLERFVFCHHRRKVAEARLAGATESVLGSKHGM